VFETLLQFVIEVPIKLLDTTRFSGVVSWALNQSLLKVYEHQNRRIDNVR
jgi:hypothetical protein